MGRALGVVFRRAEIERSLIETVLHKYERLQRQTESLAYSFYGDSSQLYREIHGQDEEKEQQKPVREGHEQGLELELGRWQELEQVQGKGGLEEGCGQEEQTNMGRVFRALARPAGEDMEECSEQLIRQTSAFFGLDLVRNEKEEDVVLSELDMSVLVAYGMCLG